MIVDCENGEFAKNLVAPENVWHNVDLRTIIDELMSASRRDGQRNIHELVVSNKLGSMPVRLPCL